MTRTSYEIDRYTEGEYDAIIGTIATDLGTQPRAIVYCHGSGVLAADVLLANRMLLRTLGRYATVHVGDLGGQRWGDDEHIERIGEAVALLKDEYGCTEVAGVAGSMGNLGLLNFVDRNPDELICAALLIPATDLVAIRANAVVASRWAEIDAIYGGDYTDHNPIDFVGDIDPDFPMKVWWSENDTLATPATVSAFLAARPETESLNMGPVSHDVPIRFNGSIKHWLVKQFSA